MMPKFHNISTLGIIILGYCLIIVLFKTALPQHQPVEQISENSAEKLHWSYGGSGNPTRWGKMAEEYALCGAGKSQSPVDIATETQLQKDSQPIQFNYQPIALTVKNNGHTIQVDYPPGSFIKIDGNIYKLYYSSFTSTLPANIQLMASRRRWKCT
jgi:carbonic anhydrase